ncbi:MAG: relaxase/mobilization nuclease domain-containing protein [Dysgonamonadaceae bacterium]|jgi:hypothetical protein|nr:relaxase/mobilization nuclease domain-containing protein [Dysgonamonadaceae bacterium]
MIAKISSGSSIYAVLSYNLDKVDANHAKVVFTCRMQDSGSGVYGMAACLRSFESRLMANSKTEKPVLHISLNPDPKDVLTDGQLSKIAEEYMQEMGYGGQPYIVFKHEDIDRRHLHIVSVRVDCEGKKINDRFEHRRSMGICRELEQRYGLVPADQKRWQEGLPLKSVRYEDGDIKHQIANVIRPIARDYHFLSLKEYRALLTLYNTGMEEIRGEANGKQYKGLVYSALNEKGEKTGSPFKSSLFGKSVGMEALEKRIEKSAEVIKSRGLKERSKKAIAAAMRTHNNRADFEGALAKQGVSVLFRENEQGRIYGATFIDHHQKCVFNGSRLGKEFSANVFNDLFSGKCLNHDLPDFKINRIDPEKSGQSFNHENQSSGIGGLLGLFSPEIEAGSDAADNAAEQAFIRRLKKKKRRQRRL